MGHALSGREAPPFFPSKQHEDEKQAKTCSFHKNNNDLPPFWPRQSEGLGSPVVEGTFRLQNIADYSRDKPRKDRERAAGIE
jgi:hypothetical protein